MNSFRRAASLPNFSRTNHRYMTNVTTNVMKISKTRYLSSSTISIMFHQQRDGMMSSIKIEGKNNNTQLMSCCSLHAAFPYCQEYVLQTYHNPHDRLQTSSSSRSFFSTSSSSKLSSSKNQPKMNDDDSNDENDDNNNLFFLLNNAGIIPSEYLNPWSYDDLEQLAICPKLDRQSRFLLSLIQTMYEKTLTHTNDRVTTDRANFILQKLLLAEEPKTEEGNEDNDAAAAATTTTSEDYDSSVSSLIDKSHHTGKLWWQKAERARAILESMELFDKYRDINQKLPFVIPHPNHETYWTVLRLYGNIHLQGYDPHHQQSNNNNNNLTQSRSSSSSLHSPPRICEEIVRRMEKSKRLELKPSNLHFNQVLAAWANSTDENRSIEAAKLLYELHHGGSSSSSSNNNNLTDASSFSHTIRACIPISEEELVPNSKFSKLALPVAIRVWKALIQEHQKSLSSPSLSSFTNTNTAAVTNTNTTTSIRISSFHIVHMLRVCKNIADPKNRVALIKEVFDKAIETQSVNIHVLQALFHVDTGTSNSSSKGGSSSSILRDYYLVRDHSRDPKKAIKQIPKKWLAVLNSNNNS